jgi:putative transposase
MARTRKKPVERQPAVAEEVLDQFGPAAGMSMEDINAATRRLKQALIERMLGGELSHHLGYPPGGDRPEETANHRHGTSAKTVVTDDGPVALEIPRDRAGTFAPVLIPKHARRLAGFDDRVLALDARGLPTREIQQCLAEI